jgi:hypothetical protein
MGNWKEPFETHEMLETAFHENAIGWTEVDNVIQMWENIG